MNLNSFTPLFSLGFALIVTLTGCSSVSEQSDESFQSFASLGQNGLKQIEQDVQANESWQFSGITIQKGQKIRVSSTGLWSGGEMKIRDNPANPSELLWCDAEGCDGNEILSHGAEEYETQERMEFNNHPDPLYRAGVTNHIFNVNNVLSETETSFATSKIGFADGLVDGKEICFSDSNVFLGSTEPNQGTGHYFNRRKAWESSLDFWTTRGNRRAVLDFAQAMIDLYTNASCLNPVTPNQIEAIILRAADDSIYDNNPPENPANTPFSWSGTEFLYQPHYFVKVPSNNFREACNSEQDIILAYYAGQVRHRIPKNDCVLAKRSSLIAKIVPNATDAEDVEPILIGKQYELKSLEVPVTGKLYFKNNDPLGGQVNNLGSLRVRVSLED